MGHYDQKIKLFYIVPRYTQGAVAYDPVLLGGCIPSTFTVQLVSQRLIKQHKKVRNVFFFFSYLKISLNM